jgi:hypothetical protein
VTDQAYFLAYRRHFEGFLAALKDGQVPAKVLPALAGIAMDNAELLSAALAREARRLANAELEGAAR